MKQLKLISGFSKKAGRNNQGKITCNHKGGSLKKKYRNIDFFRKQISNFLIYTIEYDPNRTCFITKVLDLNNPTIFSYFLLPENVSINSQIKTTLINTKILQLGDCTIIENIPIGSFIHNIEIFPGSGGIFARAAGTYAILLQKNIKTKYALIQLKSKETRLILQQCKATLGRVSNRQFNNKQYRNYKNQFFKKAGRSRWKGIRPTVRGVAKNPIDHPHGGATSGGRPSCTPWGKPTKGSPTRKNKKTKKYIIISKRQLKIKKII
jgi:large subunit ribosomal protein L2